jgi:hypothetical protein
MRMPNLLSVSAARLAILVAAALVCAGVQAQAPAPSGAASVSPAPAASVEPPATAPVLTPFGAEQAGDADGIIPAWKGGLKEVVPTWLPGHTVRPNPFYQEKALFSITAKNEADFDDMLTEGSKALLKKYADFHIDVYPTHRSAVFPQAVLDNSAANAQRCHTANGGLSVAGEGCRGGLPFPAPKTGYEAMWNHLLAWSGIAVNGRQRDWLVSRGKASLIAQTDVYRGSPWYDDLAKNPQVYKQVFADTISPLDVAGTRRLSVDNIDPEGRPPVTWEYLSGQRGAREIGNARRDLYADAGHLRTYDQDGLFSGPLDVFDFKLVGKRTVIIPYNDYKQVYYCKPADDLRPDFINPDCLRWELHRVWVVEALLKHGKHHQSPRRVFYWDEDSWSAGASDEYDARGKVYRAGFVHFTVWYESQVNSAGQYAIYDLAKGRYALYGETVAAEGGPHAIDPWPPEQLTPDIMASTSVR